MNLNFGNRIGRCGVRIILVVAVTTLTIFTGLGDSGREDDLNSSIREPLKCTPLDRNITKVVVNLIQKHHYDAPKLDDTLSEVLFDEYFERLDPNHYFFLAEDLADFASFKFILDDLLIIGDVNFAFDVYNLFVKRIQDRVRYVHERITEDFDFSVDEYMIIDRSDMPWAADISELNEVWRQRIKNELLVQKFLVVEKEDNSHDGQQATPEEKVIKRYDQYVHFREESDNADVMEIFLTTFLNILDPHSTYLNWRSVEDFDIAMKLSLQGIGATLKYVDGYTEVVNLIKGGPAEQDGRLQPGDRIIAVGQGSDRPIDVVDMPLNRVVRKIRGEKGTEVRLTILRSLHSAPEVISIVRDEVKLKDQEAKGYVEAVKTDSGEEYSIGVIDIPSFYADFDGLKAGLKDAKSTSRDVKMIIDGMVEKDGIAGILIDLRSNGGGSLEEAINLTGLFIPEGPVVQVKNQRSIQVRRDDDDGYSYSLPLTILVNRSSASASEIFSGAVKDYSRGVIVGDAGTHGKGTVQTVLKLDKLRLLKGKRPGAMKYTMAKFYRVTGASTQKKGVAADIIFPSFLDHMEIGEANLEHVMPWDEIESQTIAKSMDISQILPEVQRRADDRLKNDPEFQQLAADIERYGIRKRQKSIPLSTVKRLELKKDDEYWSERSKTILGIKKKSTDPDDGEKMEDSDNKDIYLQHAISIAADLVELSGKDNWVQGQSSTFDLK